MIYLNEYMIHEQKMQSEDWRSYVFTELTFVNY